MLALGRALVAQLRLDDRQDLLSRWMATDIAMKMAAAEVPGAGESHRQACAEAILALWTHRAALPDKKRPFENLEAVTETLRRLDPTAGGAFYMSRRRPGDAMAEKWLAVAESVDRAARTMIHTCLKYAATETGREAPDWGHLAEAAGLPAPEAVIIRYFYPGEPPDSEAEIQAEHLQDLRRTLSHFRTQARILDAALRADLAALGPIPKRKSSKDSRRERSSGYRPKSDRRGPSRKTRSPDADL